MLDNTALRMGALKRLTAALGSFVVLIIHSALPAAAQLAPHAAGVTVGHIHLVVKDVPAQEHFWVDMMGGTPVKNGPLSLIQFPGVFIMLRQDDPSGPPAGSIVDHFGLIWKDLPAAIAKWKANNIELEQGANPNQGYVHGPDGDPRGVLCRSVACSPGADESHSPLPYRCSGHASRGTQKHLAAFPESAPA